MRGSIASVLNRVEPHDRRAIITRVTAHVAASRIGRQAVARPGEACGQRVLSRHIPDAGRAILAMAATEIKEGHGGNRLPNLPQAVKTEKEVGLFETIARVSRRSEVGWGRY